MPSPEPGGSVPIRRLTVKERIQLHLIDCSRFSEDYEAPAEVTQEGIARAVGIRADRVHAKPAAQGVGHRVSEDRRSDRGALAGASLPGTQAGSGVARAPPGS